MFKAIKKSINKFLENIAAENEKQYGGKGQLDCCKLNSNKSRQQVTNK